MDSNDLSANPFTVTTPEGMDARYAVDLFVDVFSDFPKVMREGHVFLEGPRGSGKSMMFRVLGPDCQMLLRRRSFSELQFLALYIPVKETALNLTELARLRGHAADWVLNEHLMVLYVVEAAFKELAKIDYSACDGRAAQEASEFATQTLPALLRACGWSGDIPTQIYGSPGEAFAAIAASSQTLFLEMLRYVKRLSFATTVDGYVGPLCGYFDFLLPLLKELRSLSFIPHGPLFLLIDDADSLNLTQTSLLNSWVASRTSADVSLKVSTQYRYKTRRTPSGNAIEAPHDFSQVDITSVYTASRKDMYRDRIRKIVEKRLVLSELNPDPEAFFPVDQVQEDAIAAIAADYRAKHRAGEGRGARPSDDATRYARPDYIKGLGGSSKSTHTYSYAGFQQLVHVSSGVVRHFLEAAALMYGEASALVTGNEQVAFISPLIQDKVVRSQAEALLYKDLDSLRDDQAISTDDEKIASDLDHLVKALGGTFYQILISDRSERRVFSIAFSDEPDDMVRSVLDLGVRLGYFQRSSIGNKDGTGRAPLYILSRRLAPAFNLDPTSFAGYLFVTNSAIRECMLNTQSFLRRVKDNDPDDIFEPRQLQMLDPA